MPSALLLLLVRCCCRINPGFQTSAVMTNLPAGTRIYYKCDSAAACWLTSCMLQCRNSLMLCCPVVAYILRVPQFRHGYAAGSETMLLVSAWAPSSASALPPLLEALSTSWLLPTWATGEPPRAF